MKSPSSLMGLQFFHIRRVDTELGILKAINDDIIAQTHFGVYSESPFFRPVVLLRPVQFATPTSATTFPPETESLARQLKELADQKVASVTLTAMHSGSKTTAANVGFPTEFLVHTFNLELDANLTGFLSEQARLGERATERYRVILRLGWATQGLMVPLQASSDNQPHFLAPETLPRLLVVRVARRPVPLPEPIFHAGQAVKLGHRLRFSIDITDKVRRPDLLNKLFPQKTSIFSRFICYFLKKIDL